MKKKKSKQPVFTQRMTLHLNGGETFSELHYEVLRDNKPCGITRHTRTDGSPRYIKTADEMHCGEETFDILKTKGVGMNDWLDQYATK